MRIGLISDTHGKLRPGVFNRLDGVDAILHAGDIGSPDLITELEAIAPVHAVHGNTDGLDVRAVAPEELTIELGGKRFTVVHGHLLGAPTPRGLRAAYPACDVLVYGHTHRPLVDDTATPLVVNPGAAGPARFNLKPSVAVLDVGTMKVDILPLDD